MKQRGQQQLSAFELQRQQRIAENKAKLLEFGVGDARDQLLARAGKQTKAAAKPKLQRKAKSEDAARRSERNAGKERPNYKGQQELAVYVERQARLRAPGRERTAGQQQHSSSRYPSWHMGIPDAPLSAVEEAYAAAAQLAEQLTDDGTPAYIKAMTDSMVARGGWLQAPTQLRRHYCPDTDITFTTPDMTRPASDFRYTQLHRREGESRADAWTVGYLQKKDLKTGVPKGGYGFSKNWKGFAADQFLHPGDSVVFQVTGPSEAVLHIFRAWDYASEASKPDGFEAVRFSRAAVVATSGGGGDAAAGGQQGGGAAAAAAAADGVEVEEEDASKQEAAGSAAGDDSSEQADDTANQHKSAGRRSRGSSGACKTKQQAAATSAAAGAGKARKRAAPNTAAAAADSRRRQRDAGSSSSKGTKRRREGPAVAAAGAPAAAAAAAAAAAPSSCGRKKQKLEQQKPARAKQEKQGQQKAKQQQRQGRAEEVFTVDWILGTKVIGGVRVLKVRWLGYGAEFDTWEPAEAFGGDALSYDWGKLQKNGSIKRTNAPKNLTC